MKRWEVAKGLQEGLYPVGTKFKVFYPDETIGVYVCKNGCLRWIETDELVHIASANEDMWQVEKVNKKTIINLCNVGDKCVLEVDGRYFGYDKVIVDPYPETFYSNIEDAYVFNQQSDALNVTTWISGKDFRLIPIK